MPRYQGAQSVDHAFEQPRSCINAARPQGTEYSIGDRFDVVVHCIIHENRYSMLVQVLPKVSQRALDLSGGSFRSDNFPACMPVLIDWTMCQHASRTEAGTSMSNAELAMLERIRSLLIMTDDDRMSRTWRDTLIGPSLR